MAQSLTAIPNAPSGLTTSHAEPPPGEYFIVGVGCSNANAWPEAIEELLSNIAGGNFSIIVSPKGPAPTFNSKPDTNSW